MEIPSQVPFPRVQHANLLFSHAIPIATEDQKLLIFKIPHFTLFLEISYCGGVQLVACYVTFCDPCLILNV